MIKRASFNNIRRQGGWTLVELSIVLVIAGIILTAVLKGTDMINKAKVERMTADLKGLQGMMLGHEKRTGRLPGDCNENGLVEFTSFTPDAVDNNVGLGYDTDPDTDTDRCLASNQDEDEANTVWSDLRRANIVDPTRTNVNLARHTLQDFYAVGSLASQSGSSFNVIVAYGLPLWLAKALDVAMDGPQTEPGDELEGGERGRIRLYDTEGGGGPEDADGAPWPNDATLNGDYQLVSISFQYDTRMSQPGDAGAGGG
jgi:prepilin-type N-terminal cleavage/methylation domain-containing protein